MVEVDSVLLCEVLICSCSEMCSGMMEFYYTEHDS